MLGIKTKVLKIGKHSASELYPRPEFDILNIWYHITTKPLKITRR